MYRKETIFSGLNDETGEITNFKFKVVSEYREDWMKVFQKRGLQLLLFNSKLQGSSMKVLLALIFTTSYQNKILSQAKLADKLGMSTPHVNKAFKELIKAGFIVKINGEYTFDPCFAWKGTDKDREALFRNLAEDAELARKKTQYKAGE